MLVNDRHTPNQSHIPISAVINTYNEESNLSFALRSVRSWVDEIIVVDMESDDATVEVARSYGAIVYSHPRVGFADPARAFAVSKASSEWILVLDADELVPPTLARRLLEIAENSEADVVRIPWLNYFFGMPMRHTGWGPHQNRHPRFFRRDKMQFADKIHAYLHVVDGSRTIDLPVGVGLEVMHFNYTDISQFINKLNRYTSIEALQARSEHRSSSSATAAWHAIREFLVRYVRYQGFREGWRGFYVSGFMAFYRLVSDAKAAEISRNLGEQNVRAAYAEEAEKVIADYEP